MVNMNAADDKQNSNKSHKTNGVADEAEASSSSGGVASHVKLNGSSDCNKHSITNSAFAKVNVPAHNTTNGPSCSTKHNTHDVYGDTNNYETLSNGGVKQEDLLFINKTDCHRSSENSRVQLRQPASNSSHNSGVAFEYDKNSSSEDEECCIYTYKGDSKQMADLPSSFFRIMPRPDANSRNSSPDMEMEMDFDPGPSNDRYSSESGSECDDDRGEEMFAPEPAAECLPVPESPTPVEQRLDPPTPPSPLSTPSPVWATRRQSSPELLNSPAVRSLPASPVRPQTPNSNNAPAQSASCYCVAHRLSTRPDTTVDENLNEGDAGTMVWKESEAKEKQVNQIATGACGATAVINALLGLNVQFTVASVKQHVATRTRAETAPLPEYLLSRCHAGATHVDMIRGLHGASHDTVYARFFHMFPQRNISSLSSWLSHWIRKGAVPIVTRNLQRRVRPDTETPDSWHHQMVYGVSAAGIHLTNPLEVESEDRLLAQVSSPSELKVRREDVLSRWTPDTLLHPLAHPSQPLWRKMNVLGQVVNVIREGSHCSQPTQHITIPASYCSGVTLAVLRSSPAYDELRLAPELPVDPFPSS